MTPETCEQVKAEITNSAYYIRSRATLLLDPTGNLSWAESFVESAFNQAAWASNILDGALLDLRVIEQTQAPANNVLSSLESVSDALLALSNRWAVVDGFPPDGSLYVSNLLYGLDAQIRRGWNVGRNIGSRVMPYLLSAIHDLQLYNNSVNSEVDIATNRAITASATIREAMEHISAPAKDLSDAKDDLVEVRNGLQSIRATAISMQNDADSLDCSPCGRGVSSGGGSGGGSCSSVDLTPLLQAVQNLQASLEYWNQRFYELIYNFFTDYNSARSSVKSGNPSMDVYSAMGDNWFSRVEYLLYALAHPSLVGDDGSDPPSSPENSSAIDDAKSSGESLADDESQNFTSTLSTNFQRFYTSADAFFRRMVSFAPTSAGSLNGAVILANGRAENNGGWAIRLDSSSESESNFLGSGLAKVRLAFRILWSLLALALYLYSLVFFCKFVARVVAFVLKIGSSNAG